MVLHLDHAVIAVHDLDAAIQDYRSLGFTVTLGGAHANRATHNALITFANGTYLELLAPTHEPRLPGLIDFCALLRYGEGLVGFALRSEDLSVDVARLHLQGFAVGAIQPGERRRADGVLVQWQLALLEDGFAPFLIQDITPQSRRISTDPAVTTHANATLGLRAVEVEVPNLRRARDRWARLLGSASQHDQPDSCDIGDIVLREVAHAESPAGLSALYLVVDSSHEPSHFPLDQTHGVHYVC